MLRFLGTSILALGLAACADAAAPDSTSGDSATGYYRPGVEIPASADLSRGDVPRDEYGRPYTYEGLGEALPEFTGALASGASFSSSLLEGRWTVIEVWGIWCHDSRNDATYAAALSRALAQDPDVDFMSIHTPPNAEHAHRAYRSYDSVSEWFDEKGWSFPTVIDEDAAIRELLRIRWTPTYLVIAPDLTVQGFRTGLADAGDMAVKDFVQDIAETRRDWSRP
ncbi:MAG: TlpA family protein disulfide reductase [Henriciella sp.]